MRELMLSTVEISISTSLVILCLLIFSKLLNKRYVAKWKYYIWIALSLGLILPVKWELPQQKIVFEVPARMTAPIAPVSGAVTAIMPQRQKLPGLAPLDILAFLWLAGCILFLLVHLISYARCRRQVIIYGECSREYSKLCQSIAQELGITLSVPVRTYAKIGSPMVLGFFHPILVLPDMDYQQDELGFILCHELIHLKRHDTFCKFLFVAANAVHWFNPVVYLMHREAIVDMELSCDEQVICHMGFENRKAYTETLLSTLSRQYTKATKLSTEFYGGKEIMKKRFQNILNRTNKKNGLLVMILVISTALVLGMISGCTVAQEKTSETKSCYGAIIDAENVAISFVNAIIANDKNAMETYLEDSFAGELETYDGWNLALDYSRGVELLSGDEDQTADTVQVGDEYMLSYPMESERNMIVRVVLTEKGWQVREYYLEYPTGEDSLKEIVAREQERIKRALELDESGLLVDYNELLELCNPEGWIEPSDLKEADEYEVGYVISMGVGLSDTENGDTYTHLILEATKTNEGWKIQFNESEK